MRLGGQSNSRNKMFNLIGVGEKSGSGVLELFSVWENEDWIELIIEEKFAPE